MRHLIVIDDTSPSGNPNETRFIKKNQETLVAVFIHSQNRSLQERTLENINTTLKSEFGITEIHLKDLVNRENECSHLSSENVLAIIKILSDWLSKIQLPFIVQTCTDTTFIENGITLKGKYENFNFNKAKDQALFLILLKIKKFKEVFFPNDEIEIVMDEGRRKPNKVEKFNLLTDCATENIISYQSSKDFVLLQIADFFAYALNRTQMTIAKDTKTETDILLSEYFTNVLNSQYGVGVLTIEGNINEFTKDDYDYNQLVQRHIDGNLESWKRNQKK